MNNFTFINWEPSLGLDIGVMQLRYYSVMIALAFYVGYKILSNIYKKENKPKEDAESFLIYSAVGILLGLRLGHVFFYDWEYFQNHLEEILLPFKFSPELKFTGFSGLASHGGFIGGIIAVYLYCKKYKYKFLWVLDRVVAPVILGGAFVRIGNLINSEIIGVQTDKPWGFIFKNLNETTARHPTQLYEAICYISIFILLLKLYQKGKGKLKGFLSGVFMMGVFGVRFIIEFIKENQSDFEDGMILNMGQILSIPIILLGIYMIIYAQKKDTNEE